MTLKPLQYAFRYNSKVFPGYLQWSVYSDLLTTTLAPPPAVNNPFYYQCLDWPNPTRRVWPRPPYMTPVRTNKSGSTTSSTPPVQQPFYYQGLDWPNPRPALNWAAQQKTYYTVFANLDTIYGGPGQTSTFDWPNPAGLRRSLDHFQYQNLLNTLL